MQPLHCTMLPQRFNSETVHRPMCHLLQLLYSIHIVQPHMCRPRSACLTRICRAAWLASQANCQTAKPSRAITCHALNVRQQTAPLLPLHDSTALTVRMSHATANTAPLTVPRLTPTQRAGSVSARCATPCAPVTSACRRAADGDAAKRMQACNCDKQNSGTCCTQTRPLAQRPMDGSIGPNTCLRPPQPAKPQHPSTLLLRGQGTASCSAG
jgi:hypothetical protein